MGAVLVTQIDHCCPRLIVHQVSPAADQWKTVGGKVLTLRRKVQLAVEPGLNGMLVGGGHVGQMANHQGTYMVGNHILYGSIFRRWQVKPGDNPCAQNNQKRGRGSEA